MERINKGTPVIAKDGEVGFATGQTHRCRLAGCNGRRISVKWSDGRHTFPCSKGMSLDEDNNWRIQ